MPHKSNTRNNLVTSRENEELHYSHKFFFFFFNQKAKVKIKWFLYSVKVQQQNWSWNVFPEFSDFVAGANFKNIRRLLQEKPNVRRNCLRLG